MQKIIIFGGTFDPFHKAHLEVAKYAYKKLDADRMFFVVNNSPLIKQHPVATPQQRIKMLKIALLGKYRWAEVSNFEQLENNTSKPSYTVETISHFKVIYPNDKLFLLIGDDQYAQFDKWKQPEKIRSMATLVCLRRNKENINKLDDRDIILSNKRLKMCSTKIRKQLDKNVLDKNVLDYIVDNGVYLQYQVQPLMSKYRFDHTIRVMETAIKIATCIDSSLIMKVKIAALIHDIGKEFTVEKSKLFLNKKDYKNSNNFHLLHGKASANYAKKYFFITDPDILEAVESHTLPSKVSSPLTMILYLGDKLEPSRIDEDIPNRAVLLKQACVDLDSTFSHVLEYTQRKFTK